MYQIKATNSFEKKLKKLDKQIVRIINNWIIKNLINVEDPKIKGKELTGNLKGIWRYRVGDYKLFAKIENNIFILFLITEDCRKKYSYIIEIKKQFTETC